ncbi:hypothetical protein FUMI01_19900 [Flavobacterium sp. UMI-01]|nr:hypothetical protein FUMI01_19900 [Flavobacterium sp. UMI-01]
MPSISITKDGKYEDKNNDGITNVGDVIVYNFVVRNTGNVPLTNVTVTDNNATVSGGPIASLAVGAVDSTTFTAVHTVTQEDINKGIVYNLATATGTPPKGTPVTGTSTDPTPCATCPKEPTCLDCTMTELKQMPSISITKDGKYEDKNNDGITNVGDVIVYNFVIRNTGNVPLMNVTVTDNNATVSGGPIASLTVGAVDSTTFTAVHTVTQNDIDEGIVYNLATATGTPPKGTPVTGTSTDPTPCATCPKEPTCLDCTIVELVRTPAISIIKTGIFNDENKDGFTQVGETITYQFEIKNIGNVALFNVSVTDLMPGLVLSGNTIPVLNVGQVNTSAYTATYVITRDDIIALAVSNQASVRGVDARGALATDESTYVVDLPIIGGVIGCEVIPFKAVSPNGDGDNDVFYISGLDCYPDNNVQIYNRWGVLVFERDNYNNTDRAFKGVSEGRVTVSQSTELPTGTYYYVFRYKDSEANLHEKAGYLYLNR